jgi:hypothetical protein
MTLQMKTRDLEPDLVLVVEDLAGVADLTQVVSWRIIGRLNGVVVVDSAPDSAVVDPANRSRMTLTRAWVAGDTDTAGEMLIEAEGLWPGSRPQTFPPVSYAKVRFSPDLA